MSAKFHSFGKKSSVSAFLYHHALLVLNVVLLFLAFSAEASDLQVITGADSGPGSLRDAILAVNAETGGTHNIVFYGGPYQILLLSALPAITTPGTVTISGEASTLDGYYLSGEEDGLRIDTNNCTISGLFIQRFPGNGVYISGNGNTIRACSIGTDGNVALPNGGHGIFIDGGAANIIGGLTDADGNAICASGGNGVTIQGAAAVDNKILNNRIGLDRNGIPRGNEGHGVYLYDARGTKVGEPARGNWISANGKCGIFATGNVNGAIIQGNLIGTDISGFFGEGNTECGIEFKYVNGAVTVGGSDGSASNCISANTLAGIYVNSGGEGLVIKGNKLGTNVQGTASLGNYSGISIDATDNVVIGGASTGEGNLISGNNKEGVRLIGTGTMGCVIQGNSIGTSADGMSALPNEQGIAILIGANNNTIGGDSVQKGNHIAYNDSNGIMIDGLASDKNTISHNSIHENGGFGIALANGANGLISKPSIVGFGSVYGVATSNSTVEIFLDGGKTYLTSTTADAYGDFYSGVDLSAYVGRGVVVTATRDGNTSSFSEEKLVPASVACLSYASTNVPMTVGAGDADESLLTVADNLMIEDVNVTFSLQVDYVDSIIAELISPAGTAVTLVQNVPVTGSNFNGTLFDDEAIQGINSGAAPFAGSFQPVEPMSTLDGENAAGQWLLSIENGSGESAQLTAWNICVKGPAVNEITVTNTADSGPGSLREAIYAANADGQRSRIVFDTGKTDVIMPMTPLPEVTGAEPLTIDGGGSVILDGNLAGIGTGLSVQSSNNRILGLQIVNFFGAGVVLVGDGNRVARCRIGTDGTSAHPNLIGVQIYTGNDNIIGGESDTDRNIISGNTNSNVSIDSGTGNRVIGNFIGADTTGAQPVGATENNVRLLAANGNTVGGTLLGERNVILGATNGVKLSQSDTNNILGNVIVENDRGVTLYQSDNNWIGSAIAGNLISGNAEYGVFQEYEAIQNFFQGNIIGPDEDGKAYPEDQAVGMRFLYASQNVIGGTSPGEGNLVSGNTGAGIWLSGGDGYLVQGNRIGINGPGTGSLPNGGAGILVGNVSDSQIGGSNIIAYNLYGIQVDHPDAVHITITGNSIYANHNEGISLAAGANGGISPPVITGLGSVLGTAPPNTLVDVFADEEDEGRHFLGFTTASNRGRFTLDVDLRGFTEMNLTATATDGDGNTSAFSTAYPASGSEGEVVTEGEGETPDEGEGEVLPEGEGEAPDEGEGEVLPEGEGEGPDEGEGEVLPEGEGEAPGEGEGEVLPEGEGEAPGEGEGELLPEGEGEAPGEGEGEVLPEGEGEAPGEGEGELLPEGEGEAPLEGEGEVLPEGEGEVVPEGEGEAPGEGEGEVPTEGEDETGGCCASTDKGASTKEMLERMFGDWLLVGLTLISFAGLARIR